MDEALLVRGALWTAVPRGRGGLLHAGGAYVAHVGSARPSSAAAFFDLDKTIIARSSTLAFGKPLRAGGLLSRRSALLSAYAQVSYTLGGADADQMDRMRDYLAALCAGWEVDQVRRIVEATLREVVDPLVYDEAVALLEEHHASGHTVVVISSSGEEVVRPVAQMLGADETVATRMVVRDGRYTGEVAFYAYGPGKAEALREMAAQRGWDLADCYAYSDSATDLPMLEAVGHPHAVNPDRALRRAAKDRDWPVLHFSRPVRLRERVRALRPTPRSATLGALLAGAAAAALWQRATRGTV